MLPSSWRWQVSGAWEIGLRCGNQLHKTLAGPMGKQWGQRERERERGRKPMGEVIDHSLAKRGGDGEGDRCVSCIRSTAFQKWVPVSCSGRLVPTRPYCFTTQKSTVSFSAVTTASLSRGCRRPAQVPKHWYYSVQWAMLHKHIPESALLAVLTTWVPSCSVASEAAHTWWLSICWSPQPAAL
jgi:hypothetical protein